MMMHQKSLGNLREINFLLENLSPLELTAAYSFCPVEVERIIHTTSCMNASDPDTAVSVRDQYYKNWNSWINYSAELNFSGCEKKPQQAICNGIHEALSLQLNYVKDKFKKFYTINGDYAFYDIILASFNHIKIDPKQIENIEPNSFVVVSIPHHSGCIPAWFDQLIYICEKNNIKIFLDCAFWGTILKGRVNTGLNCLHTVAFSISKPFFTHGLRAGIVYSDDLAPTLSIPCSEKYFYWNINGINCANKILKEINPDYMPKKFKPLQEKICRHLDITPAEIFMFGLSQDEKFSSYKRPGANYSRLTLTSLIHFLISDGEKSVKESHKI